MNTGGAWDDAERHFAWWRGQQLGDLMLGLLAEIQPRWSDTIRPDFSMATLLFTKPSETGYSFSERVEVALEAPDRVRLELVRAVPRDGLERAGGWVTVAGDFTRPENAAAPLEALLEQLAQQQAG